MRNFAVDEYAANNCIFTRTNRTKLFPRHSPHFGALIITSIFPKCSFATATATANHHHRSAIAFVRVKNQPLENRENTRASVCWECTHMQIFTCKFWCAHFPEATNGDDDARHWIDARRRRRRRRQRRTNDAVDDNDTKRPHGHPRNVQPDPPNTAPAPALQPADMFSLDITAFYVHWKK